MNLVSIGEVLWDVIGDIEHLGGAPLNFAAHAARLGNHCYFVSAVGEDQRGDRALQGIAKLGLTPEFIQRTPRHPTGHVTVTLRDEGQPSFTIHRPAAYDLAELSPAQLRQLAALAPSWIYFGTLAQTSAVVRRTTQTLIEENPAARRFYDINLRKDCYNRELVLELLGESHVLKLNDTEIASLDEIISNSTHNRIEDFCRNCAMRFNLDAVCVTRGDKGCALLLGAHYVEAPGYSVEVVDTVGAGDAFAAGLVHALSQGYAASQAADFANRLGALVASRPGAIPDWTLNEMQRLALH